MPRDVAPGPLAPAADPDTTANSEAVSEHPLADTSGSTLLSDGDGNLSIPMTSSTRRTLRTGSAAPSPSRQPLPRRSTPSTQATVPLRTRQIRYIRSNASSPSLQRQRRTRVDDRPLHRERIDRFFVECKDAAAGHTRHVGPLHATMLEPIATQERFCLELREELAREEALLKDMRDAWQRMALRVGVGAHTIPTRSTTRHAPRPTQRPMPPVPAAQPPTRDEPGWSDLRFMPSQIASQFQSLVDTRPGGAHRASTPPPTRSPGKSASPSYRARSKRLPPIDTQSARPPALPPKDDLSADVLREKLSNGWHVLSKRLIETTSTFKDLSWMADEVPSSAPSSRPSLPPLFSDDTNDGALSRYEARLAPPHSPTGEEPHAPPLPSKSPTKSRPAPALATDVKVGVPQGPEEPLGEASMAFPTVSEPLTRDLVSLAISDPPSSADGDRATQAP